MKTFPIQERIDMLLVIGESNENCFLASRVYRQKYPDRIHPNRAVFEGLLQRFRRTGTVAYNKSNKNKHVTGNEENEFAVLGSVIENPNTSMRKISQESGISKTSVLRILKEHSYHPFHIQMHQELYEADYHRRIDFCMWVMDKIGENQDFFKCVLFSDESTFHNNGFVNRHNYHYYHTENPHLCRTTNRQHRWSLNVWGGIVADQVIGPYFFDGHLNSVMFLEFLRQHLPILLDEVPLIIRQKMWLQLDGAPPHLSLPVRNYLNQIFPYKWIGRGGPQNWPARSPDLTCLDFFLWGYVKNVVYSSSPTTREDMKIRIRNAFHSITPQMLQNTRRSFEERVQLCITQDGKQFEHLL